MEELLLVGDPVGAVDGVLALVVEVDGVLALVVGAAVGTIGGIG